jgi:hypothetical protein
MRVFFLLDIEDKIFLASFILLVACRGLPLPRHRARRCGYIVFGGPDCLKSPLSLPIS